MLGNEMRAKIDPRDYDLFVGMDTDKKSISHTILDQGAFMKTVTTPNEPRAIVNYVERNYPGKKIAFAYEAGPTGYGLHDEIKKAGYPCLVLASAMIPQIPGRRVKTNRLDSQKISVSLRGGELSGIRVPSEAYRQLRELISLRESYIKEDVRLKCRMKSMFLFEGMIFPDGNWSQKLLKALDAWECQGAVKFKLDQLLKSLRSVEEQIKDTTKEIQRFCKENEELRKYEELLRSLPGIGHIVAVYLMARLGDYHYIRSGNEIAAFFGMVPRERSTGDSVRRGSITRIGDERVRNKLIQCAWMAILRDGELKEFYERIHQRYPKGTGARKAIVAVANKICRRMACILREQRPYQIKGKLATGVKEETSSSRIGSIIERTEEATLEVR